jgi:hypothetical protein
LISRWVRLSSETIGEATEIREECIVRQLDSDLWVSESPLRFLGLEVGARMTVVRLSGGRLWLHSPVPAIPELIEQVRALGEVAYLVAPNRFHHL